MIRGRVHRFGRDVDTDVIIPARFLTSSEPVFLAAHCMEDIDPTFASRVEAGDIMAADENFGCGSSREHAPLAIKSCGVSAVVAKSFARIFYRNSINIGLPILECAEAVDDISDGDIVSIDTASGTIVNETTGNSFQAIAFPEFIASIIESGGLVEATMAKLSGQRSER
ncbi:MAG: 3-isopropylmalate dehydratase small subunit [bacterium]|nr:3-isopropylmalate dehydratase small subunit [bacterium]